MRSHHDMGGLPAGKVEPTEHDYAEWERRVDAMVQLLRGGGLFTVDELRKNIESLPHEAYDGLSYYEKWIFALSVPNVGSTTARELGRRHRNFAELVNSALLRAVLKKVGLVARRELEAPNSRKNPANSPEEKERRKALCAQLDAEVAALEAGVLAGVPSGWRTCSTGAAPEATGRG